MTQPIRPLTPMQAKVAALVGRGRSTTRIARELEIDPSTVRSHVQSIAILLPNPDELTAYRLVMLWAAQQRWEAEREEKKSA